MKIEQELKEQTEFTENEKRIADYILSHKDEVLNSSIKSLADASFTSTSAVMRLCDKLHLSGFKEFKIRFAQELSEPAQEAEIDPNFPFHKNDSVGQISSSIAKLTTQAIRDAQKTLSITDMKRAASALQQAHKVGLFGSGDSFLEVQSFQIKMMRIGVNYIISSVHGEQVHLARLLDLDDCALIISYSGDTPITLNVARELKKKRVRIIAFTANGDSPLGKIADIVLLLPRGEKRGNRKAVFYSQTVMNYYLNVLYSYLFVLEYDHRSIQIID